MPDFDILDGMDDVGKKTSKTFKSLKDNKWFKIGLIVAIGGGLLILIKNRNNSTDEEVVQYATPVGYSGYPSTSNGGSTVSMTSDELDYFKSEIAYLYGSMYEEMESNYDTLNEKLVTTTETLNTYNSELHKENVISQMKYNSDLWLTTSNENTKKALHQANQELGKSIGAVYDGGSGSWYDSEGNLLYLNTAQVLGYDTSIPYKEYDENIDYQAIINNAKNDGLPQAYINELENRRIEKIVGEGLNQYVTYDKTVDYQAQINKAIASGLSKDSTEVKYLTMQREAKIKGENLTETGEKKTTSSSSSSSNTRASKGSVKSANTVSNTVTVKQTSEPTASEKIAQLKNYASSKK